MVVLAVLALNLFHPGWAMGAAYNVRASDYAGTRGGQEKDASGSDEEKADSVS